jgi:hypothetical protein
VVIVHVHLRLILIKILKSLVLNDIYILVYLDIDNLLIIFIIDCISFQVDFLILIICNQIVSIIKMTLFIMFEINIIIIIIVFIWIILLEFQIPLIFKLGPDRTLIV